MRLYKRIICVQNDITESTIKIVAETTSRFYSENTRTKEKNVEYLVNQRNHIVKKILWTSTLFILSESNKKTNRKK